MRLQSQLLSKKRFDEHLDPLPPGAYTTTLKELDESGIHASHFTTKLLHGRHFNFNQTLGIGANRWSVGSVPLGTTIGTDRAATANVGGHSRHPDRWHTFCQPTPGLR